MEDRTLSVKLAFMTPCLCELLTWFQHTKEFMTCFSFIKEKMENLKLQHNFSKCVLLFKPGCFYSIHISSGDKNTMTNDHTDRKWTLTFEVLFESFLDDVNSLMELLFYLLQITCTLFEHMQGASVMHLLLVFPSCISKTQLLCLLCRNTNESKHSQISSVHLQHFKSLLFLCFTF